MLYEVITDELFRIVHELANRNVGIIFISHRLPELFRICDTFTVMMDGKVVANKVLDDSVKTKDIVNLMLGRNFEEAFPKRKVEIKGKVLDIKNLSDKSGKVKNVTMCARSGEIVGVSGLVGAGKTELCKLLFGADKRLSGTVITSYSIHYTKLYEGRIFTIL